MKVRERLVIGKVVYVSSDQTTPSGGIRALYRHVELLIHDGFDAIIWQYRSRLDWFSSSAPVHHGSTLAIGRDDILVVPEPFVLPGSDPAPGCRKVIYNQNHFYTFASVEPSQFPTWTPRPAVWASSATIAETLRRLKPFLPIADIRILPYAVDTQLFRPGWVKRKKVVWMPRKRRYEASLLRALFQADGRFDDVEFSSLDGVDERTTATELGTASIFIALGRDEGFGLPVAEALACGCVVVGYAAGGGAELFVAPGTHEAHDSDVLGIVDLVANLLAEGPKDEERATYRAWVENNYSTPRLLDCLKGALFSAMNEPAISGMAVHPEPQFRAIHHT